ncbi:hypothetical protein VE01_08309 [Pseudogymnoascus verrucosus]|uniref:non-specific serine/threonine protein kinase n=1 Tax=Pseudogymnoascus verrucosus TaxID=342668 RepID=A0A1B8GCM9_9PEZI|nr:uncharacterized protein VE01_08309 [Pseudogymnoascus verrucosus]OBT93570.1 hypothetical protein VE01_08309 [Pseudogymnoascus verrucosus]
MGSASSKLSRDNGKLLVRDRGTLISPSAATDSSAYDYEYILDDIDGCIHAAVAGFLEKFFDGKSWSPATQKVVSSVDLDDFKTSSSKIESPIDLCLLLHEVLKLNERGVIYCPVQTPPSKSPLRPSGGIALFSAITESEPRAEVVGVFRPGGASDYKDGLFELFGHARAVFSKRPDRSFVHGFYLFGNTMECWMFDRSGAYSCEPFNTTEHPERFLTIMDAYASMSDQEWGRSNFIKEDSEGTYVCVEDEKTKVPGKMYLQTPPFFIRDEEVIARGSLLCHRGRESPDAPWNFVVKYKWKPPWHEPEAEQLKRVRDRNVWGVVQFHSYKVIDKTEDLRRDLIFGPPQQFKDTEAVEQTAESNETSAGAVGAKALLETFEENRPNLPKSPGYRSTVFSCLIISPPGTSIFDYANLHQLLEVFRDAIKAHRSLYQDGGILHRDIAASNIIIAPPTTSAESPKGMLIDLDTAWDISRGPTPQGSMVGTSPFMAIGALEAYVQNNPRTYRHDLESFFYVFLFIAICPREEDGTKTEELPETSRLLQWRQDKRQQVRKTADMGEKGFEAVLEEFSPEFECLKGLARILRGILFPLKDGKIWTWTDMSPEGTNKLYDDMTEAFKDALVSIVVDAEPRYPTTTSITEIKAPGLNLLAWLWLPKR